MTAEQTAENIKAKIDELANKAAERMDALADVADDHDSVTAPSSTSSARSSSTSSSGNKSAEAEPSPIALACDQRSPLTFHNVYFTE
jgi:hypothetical protein